MNALVKQLLDAASKAELAIATMPRGVTRDRLVANLAEIDQRIAELSDMLFFYAD